ncbi:hypothetical protein [Campylobacter showae]|nr:hypothetical protein [Campylobacter showae]
MSAFKTVKFTSSAGKFEPSNLTMAFAKFKIHSRKFGATKK